MPTRAPNRCWVQVDGHGAEWHREEWVGPKEGRTHCGIPLGPMPRRGRRLHVPDGGMVHQKCQTGWYHEWSGR